MAEGEGIVQEAEHTLNTKVLGLPLWGVAIGVVVIGGAVYFFILKPSGAVSPASTPTGIGGIGAPSGTFGTDTGLGTQGPTTPTYTNNTDWLNAATLAVVKALGGTFSYQEVQLYLTEYLNGNAPGGSAHASGLFQQVIQMALQLVGAPPIQPVPYNPGNNQFTTPLQWLTSVLTLIPGVAQSDILQLQNLFAGKTHTLSQSAATLLQQMVDLLGLPPGGLPQFSIQGSGPPTKPGLQLNLQQLTNSLNSLGLWLAQNPGLPSVQNAGQAWLNTFRLYEPGPAWQAFLTQEQQKFIAGIAQQSPSSLMTWYHAFQVGFIGDALHQGLL